MKSSAAGHEARLVLSLPRAAGAYWPIALIWFSAALAWWVLVVLALCPASAWASGSWSTGIEASLPANANADPVPDFSSVSCASAGNCTAVGSYYDSSGQYPGLVLSESGGTWSTGIEAPLPASATGMSFLRSVSCASAGNCTAVGYYIDSSLQGQGLLLSQSGGTWSTGTEAPLPANANTTSQNADVYSVSCASAGNCTAVGQYKDSLGNNETVLFTESGGSWSTGIVAPVPANAGGSGYYISSVSCASAGDCTAVGRYGDSSGHSQGLLLSESGGSWSTGVEAPLPANANASPGVDLRSVSCASPGDCTAVGSYSDSQGNPEGLLLSESGGSWSTGIEASLPANVDVDPGVFLQSVSCSTAGDCTAVGGYNDNLGNYQGVLLTESGGTWSTGIEASRPNPSPSQSYTPSSVSCASAGDCAAVSDYNDIAGYAQGELLDESGGTWSTATEAPVPANGKGTGSHLVSVSCASAGNCTAVGSYVDNNNHGQGLLLSESSAPPSAPLLVSGPTVSSTTVGSTPSYTCSAVFSGSPSPNVSYQWLRGGTVVGSGSGYVASGADAGAQLVCHVTATNSSGSASGSSAPVHVPSYWPPVVTTGGVTNNPPTSPCAGTPYNRDYTYVDFSNCNFVSATLGGVVVPGSVAQLRYYFKYGTDPTFRCNNPLHQGFIECDQYPEPNGSSLPLLGIGTGGPISLKLVCIGRPCPGETVTDRLSQSLSLPHEWYVQLVVDDGHRPQTKGNVVGFVPANQVNPPLFPLSGTFQLNIDCPNACPELQFNTVNGSIIQGSGSDQGTLTLTPSNGNVKGGITGLTNGGILYNVTGTIGLSTIRLDAAGYCRPGGPLLCGRPQSFTLSGQVLSYGYDQQQLTPTYLPEFGGVIPGGGTWSACLTPTPNCWSPNAVKSNANAISYWLTVAAFIPVVGQATAAIALAASTASAVMVVIANDPPDHHYKRVVRPVRVAAVRLPAINGLSHRAATAATRILSALQHANADGITFVSALQRYEGAVQAKDRKWSIIQLRTTRKYGRRASAWYQRAASLLVTDHQLLAHSPLGRKAVNPRALIRALRSIRKHGLPRSLAHELKRLGISARNIRAMGKYMATSLPPGARTLLGPILSPSFRHDLQNFTRALNTYLTGLRALPAQSGHD